MQLLLAFTLAAFGASEEAFASSVKNTASHTPQAPSSLQQRIASLAEPFERPFLRP